MLSATRRSVCTTIHLKRFRIARTIEPTQLRNLRATYFLVSRVSILALASAVASGVSILRLCTPNFHSRYILALHWALYTQH